MPPVITNNHLDIGPCDHHGLDPKRMLAQHFGSVYTHAYLEASDEVQEVIDAMARIVANEQADAEDRASALDTLTDALFPRMHEGELGIDLIDVKMRPHDETDAPAIETKMADQEATFATRLASVMETQNISQEQLAEMTGVGQSAISMMLARNCRPQRRTIKKITDALKMNPQDLWPDYSD